MGFLALDWWISVFFDNLLVNFEFFRPELVDKFSYIFFLLIVNFFHIFLQPIDKNHEFSFMTISQISYIFFRNLLKNLHIFPHDSLTNCISFFCGQFMNWFFKWMTEEVCDIFYWQLTEKFHRFSDNQTVNFAENDNLKCFAEKLFVLEHTSYY